ncbi:DNA-3-methyladenine glycosylase I [Streptococcus macacae]|uniref:Methyladenine glycosylase n=1 Tax=Streptococcus macacae NCTC 11558 TaxID=764298 RepID=G5JWZ5_9STRE|nr:DNA-3-methyladenine glycosylase I [Streptococcus macacae]EHJ52383.1 methyladenine glycosylase [Streptococcus macacae NCTC 11558]SUN79471.1 DNA-3-methyladenine glycosylase I [Streptococcus macacae NCTC 11558]
MQRCSWVKESNPLYVAYHDKEWGKPLHDDQKLFELLCLESYQSGLSWEVVLNKRAAFKEAFYNYNIEKVSQMTDADLEELLQNEHIIRNKRKIYATRTNAQAFLILQRKFGSFDSYLWSWVNFSPIINAVKDYKEVASKTKLSEEITKDLKNYGFKFIGPVCIYSYLQAVGLVNDHEENCAFK